MRAERELNNVRQDLAETRKDLVDARKELVDARSERDNAKTVCDESGRKLNDASLFIRALEANCLVETARANADALRVTHLEQVMSAQRTEQQDWLRKISTERTTETAASKKREADLVASLATSQALLAEERAARAICQQQLAAERASLASCQNQLAAERVATNACRNQLTAERAAMTAERAAMTSERAALTAERAAMTDSQKKQADERAECQRQLSIVQQQLADDRPRMASLQSQLAALLDEKRQALLILTRLRSSPTPIPSSSSPIPSSSYSAYGLPAKTAAEGAVGERAAGETVPIGGHQIRRAQIGTGVGIARLLAPTKSEPLPKPAANVGGLMASGAQKPHSVAAEGAPGAKKAEGERGLQAEGERPLMDVVREVATEYVRLENDKTTAKRRLDAHKADLARRVAASQVMLASALAEREAAEQRANTLSHLVEQLRENREALKIAHAICIECKANAARLAWTGCGTVLLCVSCFRKQTDRTKHRCPYCTTPPRGPHYFRVQFGPHK